MSSAIRSLALLCLFAATSFHVDAADELAAQFSQPPAATRPRCYWYWMDGHISKEGITKDLEAMKRVGIGGAFIGVISGQSGAAANPDPKALTPQWWGFIEHAIREGSRIGVQIGLFNSPGWSQSGGPWVTPEQAMRYVVQTETAVKGPQQFSAKLPAPQEGFQPLTIQAFPAPAGEAATAAITSRTGDAIVFQMPENTSARSLTVRPTEKVNAAAELQASADGTNFRTVRKFQISRHNMMLGVGPVPLAPVVISFPAVADRHFRLLCGSGRRAWRCPALRRRPRGKLRREILAQDVPGALAALRLLHLAASPGTGISRISASARKPSSTSPKTSARTAPWNGTSRPAIGSSCAADSCPPAPKTRPLPPRPPDSKWTR